MSRRTIRKSSRYCETHVAELLQGLLVSEMIAPSSTLWLVSAWVSDISVIDNRDGAFAGLSTSLPVRWVRLSEALTAIALAGGAVVVVTNDDEHNQVFERRLHGTTDVEGVRRRISFRQDVDLHAKGLLGDGFYLSGSMNFTFNGVRVLTEEVALDTDSDSVNRSRIEFVRWYGTGRQE